MEGTAKISFFSFQVEISQELNLDFLMVIAHSHKFCTKIQTNLLLEFELMPVLILVCTTKCARIITNHNQVC
jgi:hypothetical protein